MNNEKFHDNFDVERKIKGIMKWYGSMLWNNRESITGINNKMVMSYPIEEHSPSLQKWKTKFCHRQWVSNEENLFSISFAKGTWTVYGFRNKFQGHFTIQIEDRSIFFEMTLAAACKRQERNGGFRKVDCDGEKLNEWLRFVFIYLLSEKFVNPCGNN